MCRKAGIGCCCCYCCLYRCTFPRFGSTQRDTHCSLCTRGLGTAKGPCTVARLAEIRASRARLACLAVKNLVHLGSSAYTLLVLAYPTVPARAARSLHGVCGSPAIHTPAGGHVLAGIARLAWCTVVGVGRKRVTLAPGAHVRVVRTPESSKNHKESKSKHTMRQLERKMVFAPVVALCTLPTVKYG